MSGCPEEKTEPRPCTQMRATSRRRRGSVITPSSQTPSPVRTRTSETGTRATIVMAGQCSDFWASSSPKRSPRSLCYLRAGPCRRAPRRARAAGEGERDMARIAHIAIKVTDLEKATRFYEDVFGFRQVSTGHARGHVSRHMTDGNIDLALMVYDSEDVEEAQLSGPGPCIHHWGIEVEDRDSYVAKIEANGGTIISEPGEGALKFRAPDGTVAEIVGAGRYKKKKAEKAPA